MKKNLLLILAVLYSSLAFAQTMDSVLDGKHYYIVSPNGRYFTGTVDEGPAVFYDMKVKEH